METKTEEVKKKNILVLAAEQIPEDMLDVTLEKFQKDAVHVKGPYINKIIRERDFDPVDVPCEELNFEFSHRVCFQAESTVDFRTTYLIVKINEHLFFGVEIEKSVLPSTLQYDLRWGSIFSKYEEAKDWLNQREITKFERMKNGPVS